MTIKSTLKKSNIRGATMVEYGVMLSLILVVGVVAFRTMGTQVRDRATAASAAL